MAKKITLADIAKILKKDKTKGDTSYWGVVQSVNTTDGKVTSYNVSLGGDAGTVKCRKLAGAKVNDTVLVTLRSTGEAIVVGTKNGDTDASDAKEAADTADGKATAAQGTANAAQQTANSASTTATNAYNKAAAVENHFWYDSNGAHVSLANPITSGTLNTLINAGGMSIRDGSTELAKFTDSLIELGKNNSDTQIKMCGGRVKIYKYTDGAFYMENTNASETKKAYVSFSCIDADNESVVNIHAKASNTSPQAGVIIADGANSSYVSISGGTVNINGSTLADFVTEQGTSSNWNYRKWRSGKIELWRTYTSSFAMTTSQMGAYSSDAAKTLTLPFSVSNAVCLVSGASEGEYAICSVSGTTLTWRPFRHNSSSSNSRTFSFKVEGTY